ncbi:MAG: bifunctional phosphopantothenoylcysteine decarboxylase/phosphopantothenate--cysteine ligase CoaBC [Deltaproteobacteria bacterium]|nr:bifunctional phosphopantothenoylcysteine decarboxylase/phosphopantothenate--cysteine ligase CoaBC [Deltaproteobacteria bacterium]
MNFNSDLTVDRRSDALTGRQIDVVVSGSIGSVEAVKFIRSLRRLGAAVTPWLTSGGAQFVTPLALAWAAGRDVRQAFTGDASHIALGDACVVAPASANLLGKCANGITDTPATALIASYLGSRKPVLILPNMHDSLAQAPAVMKNRETLAANGAQLLAARVEEGKQKFPEPAVLADEVAHRLNRHAAKEAAVLVTLGTTRGYIDDVRYLSNYSTGTLGSLIAEELYRCGIATHVVCGPCPRQPKSYTSLAAVATNEEMTAAASAAIASGADAAVLAASVLDFTPEHRASGKIPSSANSKLSLNLVRTPKIIAGINPRSGIKVGFKLETDLTATRAEALALDYFAKYQLSLMVINDLSQVDATRHQAYVASYSDARAGKGRLELQLLDGKNAVAEAVAGHVAARLRG